MKSVRVCSFFVLSLGIGIASGLPAFAQSLFEPPVPLPPSRGVDNPSPSAESLSSSDRDFAQSLPACPNAEPQKWNNCVGSLQVGNQGRYSGEFKNGRPDGSGVFTSRDGSVYQGEFQSGIPSGKGKFSSPNGNIYIGEFANGVANGEGTEQVADGSSYIGSFANGVRDGKGKLTFPDGRTYEGEFKADKFEGNGTFGFADGNSYTGVFSNNEPTERGIFRFVNGDRYVGEYKNFIPHGQGVLTFASGRKYIGVFVEGAPIGFGAFYDDNGALIHEGEFNGFASLEDALTRYAAKSKSGVASQPAPSISTNEKTDQQQPPPPQQTVINADPGSTQSDVTSQVDTSSDGTASLAKDASKPVISGGSGAPAPDLSSQASPMLGTAGQNSVHSQQKMAGASSAGDAAAQSPDPTSQTTSGATQSGNPPLGCKRSGDLLVSFIVCSVEATQIEIDDIRFPNSTCQSGRDYLKEYDRARSVAWFNIVTLFKAYFYFRPFDYRGAHRFRDKVYFLVRNCSGAADFTIRINNEDWTWPKDGQPATKKI